MEELLCGIYCLKLLVYFLIDRVNGRNARIRVMNEGSEMIESRFEASKCSENTCMSLEKKKVLGNQRKQTHVGDTHFPGRKCTVISLSIVGVKGEADEADQTVDWA